MKNLLHIGVPILKHITVIPDVRIEDATSTVHTEFMTLVESLPKMKDTFTNSP